MSQSTKTSESVFLHVKNSRVNTVRSRINQSVASLSESEDTPRRHAVGDGVDGVDHNNGDNYRNYIFLGGGE